MIVYLFNHAHNGDVLLSSEMVKILINSNKDIKFIIMPACSSFLFKDCINDNISIEEHPVRWNHNNNSIYSNINNHITSMQNTKWKLINNNLYINTWLLLVSDNITCISLQNRIEYICNLLKEIELNTSIHLNFNCDNYKELIPNLPHINIDYVKNKLNTYNKKIIFFYNQVGGSGQDHKFSLDLLDKYILKLIDLHSHDSMIILSKPTNIQHECILNVEKEFNSIPSINGENLVLNAKIANLSDIVYFRNNGGSLFILNNENINNSKVKYYYLGDEESIYKTMVEEYNLNCKNIVEEYNLNYKTIVEEYNLNCKLEKI